MANVRKTDDAVILKLHSKGKSLREISAVFGVSKQAVRKQLLRLQAKALNTNAEKTSKPKAETTEILTPKVLSKGYLRKIGTREVFAFSPYLMKRGDMITYTGLIPVPDNFEIPQNEIYWLSLVKGKEGLR